MTKYLTVEEVVTIHNHFVKKFGGVLGIRDAGLLESAVFRCQASFGGNDLYETIFAKAAAILHSMIFDHPFVDGNKRAAIMSAFSLLVRNGYDFKATDKELEAFPLAVEKNRPEISEIAKWLKTHSKRIEPRFC
ncbi:type II toxin-antitoxin system death-on-curing family toxin [Candidatus Gottesmanbacteria bacterium]|nr:type II toxin-antitoxin system death-on-curing family toxin [Candidatus Gottesmanbacteria bacterium]